MMLGSIEMRYGTVHELRHLLDWANSTRDHNDLPRFGATVFRPLFVSARAFKELKEPTCKINPPVPHRIL
jgi:hypothetical protein